MHDLKNRIYEFAQQGIMALQKELSYSDSPEFDSPFEESVYDFLLIKGYNVSTQVGCSGFRIDMAVKHPSQSGVFAIGIECDGAAYHSSRTARERDRLRQTVLEEMGWIIYRIWSTDWIKDHTSEQQKLICAIEAAFDKPINETIIEEEVGQYSDAAINSIEIEEIDNTDHITGNSCGFIPYQRLVLSDYRDFEALDIIIKAIEIEQPIHFEELCKRIAPLFGNQKVTSKVRIGMGNILQYKFGSTVRRHGDFITLKGFEELQVRVANVNDDYVRPISYISNEELCMAMRAIIMHSYGITPADLLVATAREFGYKRTGGNIILALQNAYDTLKNTGVIKIIDGKLIARKDA